LLDGPPGLGKTFLVLAVRNQLYADNIEVLWRPIDLGSVGSKYINQTAVNVRNVFDVARKASDSFELVFYFLDECDDFLMPRNRARGHHDYSQVTNEFLKQLQEVRDSPKEVLFMATNFGRDLDKAGVRAGRVDKVLRFCLPDERARRVCFSKYIGRVNENADYLVFDGIDLDRVGRASDGFSYADIASVVENSVRSSVGKAIAQPQDYVNGPPVVDESLLFASVVEHKSRIHTDSRRIGYVTDRKTKA